MELDLSDLRRAAPRGILGDGAGNVYSGGEGDVGGCVLARRGRPEVSGGDGGSEIPADPLRLARSLCRQGADVSSAHQRMGSGGEAVFLLAAFTALHGGVVSVHAAVLRDVCDGGALAWDCSAEDPAGVSAVRNADPEFHLPADDAASACAFDGADDGGRGAAGAGTPQPRGAVRDLRTRIPVCVELFQSASALCDGVPVRDRLFPPGETAGISSVCSVGGGGVLRAADSSAESEYVPDLEGAGAGCAAGAAGGKFDSAAVCAGAAAAAVSLAAAGASGAGCGVFLSDGADPDPGEGELERDAAESAGAGVLHAVLDGGDVCGFDPAGGVCGADDLSDGVSAAGSSAGARSVPLSFALRSGVGRGCGADRALRSVYDAELCGESENLVQSFAAGAGGGAAEACAGGGESGEYCLERFSVSVVCRAGV